MSEGVYLRLSGKILVRGGAESRHGLSGKTALPLLGVHSGKMAMTLF
jgi:hypothetical protein